MKCVGKYMPLYLICSNAKKEQPLCDKIAFQTCFGEIYTCSSLNLGPGHVVQSVGHLTRKSGVLGSIPGHTTTLNLVLIAVGHQSIW